MMTKSKFWPAISSIVASLFSMVGNSGGGGEGLEGFIRDSRGAVELSREDVQLAIVLKSHE